MAFKDELKATVAAEKEQVKVKIDALGAKVADLEAKLAAGEVVTPSDVAEIKADIENIFTDTTDPA